MDKKFDFLNMIVALLPYHFNIEVSHFIASQFALESNFGESPMAKCTNNYCGMKVPALRFTLCSNSALKFVGSFAEYPGVTSCVHDYVIWLTYNRFKREELNNLDLFVKHLHVSGYCPEPDYIERIKSIYNQFYSYEKN